VPVSLFNPVAGSKPFASYVISSVFADSAATSSLVFPSAFLPFISYPSLSYKVPVSLFKPVAGSKPFASYVISSVVVVTPAAASVSSSTGAVVTGTTVDITSTAASAGVVEGSTGFSVSETTGS
jgi:hypothetical protein